MDVSKLSETFKKYNDCQSNAYSDEKELWGLIKEFLKEHGRFEYEIDWDDLDNDVQATYTGGDRILECLLKSMYIEDGDLSFDILVRYYEWEGYIYEENGIPFYQLEFEYGLHNLVRQIENCCNKK